jgi:hypothetical protein
MDDTTRRHWEQIADATIDRAIAAAMGELKASQPELEDTADTWGLVLAWDTQGLTH